MPVMHLHIWEGPDTETKNTLAAKLTQELVNHLGCPPDAVTILIDEVKKPQWYIGGVDSRTKFSDE
jgi:4-oxalocrotonate tautomerase